jgi:hypothetical protein
MAFRLHRARLCAGLRAVIATTVFVLAAGADAQSSQTFPAADHIVVIGDVHGAYDAMFEILESTGVIDADGAWTGDDSQLVSLGDLLDRGPDSRAAMDLLMKLQDSAPATGGEVHVVMGNHEQMNVIGDLRYTSAAEYAAFAADETAEMRDDAFDVWVAEQTDPATATREQFDARFPAGYFAHRAAFAPEGEYGAWLLDRPAIVVIGETAFVHGGLPPIVADLGLDGTNEAVHDAIGRYLSVRESLADAGALPAFDTRNDLRIVQQRLAAADSDEGGDDSAGNAATEPVPLPQMQTFFDLATSGIGGTEGPLWYRGSVYCKPVLERPVLDASLAALDATRVVVGHTPTETHHAQVRLDGHLIMVDTGMLADYYHGMATALIIEGDNLFVQYQGQSAPTRLDTSRVQASYGLTEAEIRDALANGDIASTTTEPEADVTQVTLDIGGIAMHAVFVPDDAGGALELAAGILDDLIGAQMVAPSVAREIGGAAGTLELVYPDSISEAERLVARRVISEWCPIEPQLHLMYLFDALIANEGRTTDDILFINDVSQLMLTGHENAFGTGRRLPSSLDPSTLQIPSPVLDGLRGLDESRLEARLGDILDRREIRALLARRDELIDGR